jgi:hypothetical protein
MEGKLEMKILGLVEDIVDVYTYKMSSSIT